MASVKMNGILFYNLFYMHKCIEEWNVKQYDIWDMWALNYQRRSIIHMSMYKPNDVYLAKMNNHLIMDLVNNCPQESLAKCIVIVFDFGVEDTRWMPIFYV